MVKPDGYLGSGPGGAQGFKITEWFNSFAGKIGTGIILTFTTIGYLIFALRFKPETFTRTIPASIKSVIPGIKTDNATEEPAEDLKDTAVEASDEDDTEDEKELRMRKKLNLL